MPAPLQPPSPRCAVEISDGIPVLVGNGVAAAVSGAPIQTGNGATLIPINSVLQVGAPLRGMRAGLCVCMCVCGCVGMAVGGGMLNLKGSECGSAPCHTNPRVHILPPPNPPYLPVRQPQGRHRLPPPPDEWPHSDVLLRRPQRLLRLRLRMLHRLRRHHLQVLSGKRTCGRQHLPRSPCIAPA